MKKIRHIAFPVLLIFLSVAGRGQTADTTYRFPLDLPPLLSATFGELRPGHFHAGLDIKTRGQTGYKVYAIAGGYIFRVKVQRGGYGKAVYIRHPDGKISVYAHLSAFPRDLERYVKNKQYARKSFFVDLRLNENLFPVQKGQIIGYSGNTGGSFGPHLHFEMREDEAHPVNPMRFGFTVPDTIAPRLQELWIYALDSAGHPQGFRQWSWDKYTGKKYVFTPIEANGYIGLGIRAFDRQNNTWNKNGLYRVSLWVNGIKTYETRMDRLDYYRNKRINLLIDYSRYVSTGAYIQRLWKHPLATLPVFTQLVRHGILYVEPGKTYHIQIRMADFSGNQSVAELWINGKRGTGTFQPIPKQPVPDGAVTAGVSWNRPARLKGDLVTVDIPRHAVYDSIRLVLTEAYQSFTLGDPRIPLDKAFRLRMSLKQVEPEMKKYAYLARQHPRNGKFYFATARKSKDSLVLTSSRLGHYRILFDSIPPVIKGLNFKNKQWISKYRFIRFRVGDAQTGIAGVQARIDGQWILIDWDPKTGKCRYDMDDLSFPGAKHLLTVRVTDRAGNSTEIRRWFFRKY